MVGSSHRSPEPWSLSGLNNSHFPTSPRKGVLKVFDEWLTELRSTDVDDKTRRELCDLAASSARTRAGLDAFDARLGAAIAGLDDGGPGASTVYRAAGALLSEGGGSAGSSV